MSDFENRKAIALRIFELENLLLLAKHLMQSENAKQMNKRLLAMQRKIDQLDEIPLPGQDQNQN